MILIPAIDIYQGRCVRLFQGQFDQATYYDVEPDTLAKRYAINGASWLHLVNLDAAQDGGQVDFTQLRTLCQIDGLKIQSGGGLRDQERVQHALQMGVGRVVIGSLVLTAPDILVSCIRDYGPDRITLALDVRIDGDDPKLASHGWKEQSDVTLWQALDDFGKLGIRDVLCTDISRDGAMQGPNIELYAKCTERYTDMAFQASGGVRDINDLNALAQTNVAAAIVGRALYENSKLLEDARPFLPNA